MDMSFGQALRRERELRRISLREVAHATKIRLRYLEAMERNDFECLPGGLFNRGFVRAYCEHIGIDPEAMVNAYLLEQRTEAETAATAGPADGLLRGGGVRPGPAPRGVGPAQRRSHGNRVRLVVIALVVLVVTAGAVALWHALAAGDEGGISRATTGAGPVASDLAATGGRGGGT
jgi:cytoskeletal protein RodZ